MPRLRVSEVFVPGGLPQHTYVSREPKRLEERLQEVKDNFCKIATVTGATKSGKTVLVKKVFTSARVWLEGGAIRSLSDFWDTVSDQLEAAETREVAESTDTGSELNTEITLEANVFVAKGTGKVAPKRTFHRTRSTTRKVATFKPAQCLRLLGNTKTPLIIDDFHYVDRVLQAEITRILKPLVFEGVPVVYLAIPHRRFDAVKVEREMNGRVSNIPVPMWDEDELIEIAQLGFPLLKIKTHFHT